MSDLPEKKHIEVENVGSVEDPDDVVAKVPKETLKALLYMAAGKPDSNIKLFRDPICIQPNDIIELNDEIQEKLRNHDILAALTTVNIVYAKNEIEQYGVWAEFVGHKWNTPQETESLTIKWDFVVKLPTYTMPQRHTVLVKVASKLTPLHVMQAMFSKDPDEIENLESEIAPVVCRIDFINHVLSAELMRIVEQWHSARIKPLFNPTYEKFLDKHKSLIAKTIHYSIPFFATLLAAGLLNKYISISYLGTTKITVEIMKSFMFWLLGSAIAITFINQTIAHSIASRAYQGIESYGEHTVFDFTNGDKNKQRKIEQKNKDSIRKFFVSVVGAILLNIISSVITAFLFQ